MHRQTWKWWRRSWAKGKKFCYLRFTEKDRRIAKRRLYEQTEEFKDRYRWRAGVEATMSEYDRRTGGRNFLYKAAAEMKNHHQADFFPNNRQLLFTTASTLEPAYRPFNQGGDFVDARAHIFHKVNAVQQG